MMYVQRLWIFMDMFLHPWLSIRKLFLSMSFVVGTLLALCIPNLVYAQGKNPFYVEILAPKLQFNTPNTIDVIFVVPPDHHLYRDMMVVNVTSSKQTSPKQQNIKSKKASKESKASNMISSAILEIGEPIFPDGVFVQDPANPIDLRELYKSTAKIQIPITSHEMGTYEIQLYIRYQGCKKTLCYMPQYEDHVIDLTVTNQ